MKINKNLGIYVHIPFCIKKCRYCDFVSGPSDSNTRSEYLKKIKEDIKAAGLLYKDRYFVDTVFFGGGTPTVLEAEDLAGVLDCIKESFEGSFEEVSCEANPGTVTETKLIKMKESGFNRLSIGVQSFDNTVLKKLGRIHDSKEAEEAVKMALSEGFNTNLDLMFGVPGQTPEIWEKTLEKTISLDPDHISFYSLQLEEGTPMYEDYRFGELVLPSWDENRMMYHTAVEKLKSAGYHHYEISNAAKPGFECRHNLKYWSMEEYLGIGDAAHSYIDGKRTGEESPDPEGDFIFTRLRLIDGFPKDEFRKRFGYDLDFTHEGICEENGMIKLNKKGLDNTNPVMHDLLLRLKR